MGLLETFPVCRVGGWLAGSIEIITNSAQLGLELGLSLAMFNDIIGVYLVRVFTQMGPTTSRVKV